MEGTGWERDGRSSVGVEEYHVLGGRGTVLVESDRVSDEKKTVVVEQDLPTG